jgi:acetate kinase
MGEHPVLLVLNAGSSSLKFCVYGEARDGESPDAWRLEEERGQIE